MYARRVGDRVLTFGVSGKLWRDALVMFDRETGSLWSHVTGECIEGELIGEHLTPLAAELLPYGEWVEKYPDSKILPRRASSDASSHYAGYVASDDLGIFGTQAKREELPQKEIIHGVAYGGDAAAIVSSAFEEQESVEFTLAGREFVARKAGSAVHVFRRSEDGKLEPYPTTTAYWFGWVNFYPGAEVIR